MLKKIRANFKEFGLLALLLPFIFILKYYLRLWGFI